MSPRTCASRTAALCLLVIATVFFLLSVILLAIFPGIYENQLEHQLFLVKGSTLFPMWRELPLPIYEKLYFFNITNGEEFVNGAKLNVTQVGPYTYKSTWVKENIRWYPNKTVSYQERRINQFVPEMSVGSEDDNIITLNGPMIMAANFCKDKNKVWKWGLNGFFYFNDEEIVIEKSVRQLAFSGYEDPIIADGKWLIEGLPFKNGVFSWLYDKNDTYDGTFTVSTGERGIDHLNVIEKWNGNSKVNYWKNESCNMINGSSGEMGPPLKDGQTKFTFFQSLFCRSLTFSYASDEVHHGLLTKRFIADEKVFGNETVNEDNACFDTKPYLPSGVQDISGCQFGAPVVISLPHFYLADPVYLEQTNGLDPNEKEHSSNLDVEPKTGISISILLRAQLNLEVEPVFGVTRTESLPKGVFPVLWFEISADVPEERIKYLMNTMNRPKVIFYTVTGLLLLVSVVLFIFGIVVFRRAKKHRESIREPMLMNRDSDKVYRATDSYPKSSDAQSGTQTQNPQAATNSLVINQSEHNADDEMLIKVN